MLPGDFTVSEGHKHPLVIGMHMNMCKKWKCQESWIEYIHKLIV
jgi:hypothetical protein